MIRIMQRLPTGAVGEDNHERFNRIRYVLKWRHAGKVTVHNNPSNTILQIVAAYLDTARGAVGDVWIWEFDRQQCQRCKIPALLAVRCTRCRYHAYVTSISSRDGHEEQPSDCETQN